ncbi:hypothetical protein AB4027_03650 [Alkalibacterium putridalgicola]|uniref:Uncharacterized protein n=1 Tax=Alkalibacterium putridalgicola TaxID=426703 RepID=A0A1H7VZL4_9LACT|nr:hypothetical protein [Alkalibacterium putridalgicola]GEK89358.1 hypothetical protein APU01nite_13970 [Alkalibacterium putridalgicola]SEM14227.1 hypothetical protein SAMN04488100_12837 [Alkalibacterium putridalgicola]
MLFTEVSDEHAKDKHPAEILAIVTGIDKKVIMEGVNEHGYQNVLDEPSLLDISEEDQKRIIEARKMGYLDATLL